jgi:uncharacterized protein
MNSPFRPAWWLPGPHLQTLWGKLFRRQVSLPVQLERWETPDDDAVHVVRLSASAHAPRLLLLHGLEGSPRSHYASGIIDGARRRGWAADMLVFRTCNGELNRLPRSYHSGETGDLDFVISRIVREHPESRLFLIGISLGGNVLLKWLGEMGAGYPRQIAGAAAVSVPFDLARSSRHIGLGAARLYQWHFLRLLRAKALAKVARHPTIANPARVSASRTLWDFDDAFTSVVHGFRDAADYYARSSSLRFLEHIRVPTYLLSARDDPFHPPAVLTEVEELASRNPLLLPEFVDRGGHVGFVGGANPFRPEYYLEERLLQVASQRLAGPRGTSAPPAMERALTASYDLQV